jgi:hypothetical protein
MPNLTDYTVIEDNSVTLPKSNGDIDHDYPKFGAAGLADGRSILMFRVNPDNTAELVVSLNGTNVVTQTFDTEPQRSWHEVIDDGVLKDSDNILTITRNSGSGSLTVSDVVVLYQHAI